MTPVTDSPQARLAASREALVKQMAHDDGWSDDDRPRDFSDPAQAADTRRKTQPTNTLQVIRQALMAWWQHHPAQIAIDIGRPFLSNYARDRPFQLLGIAVCAGVAAAVVRPWRLVSVTGLAVAALKSTRLSSTLLSLIPRAASRSNHSSYNDLDRTHHPQPPKDAL